MTTDAALQDMLKLVERHEREHCRAAMARAQQEADALIEQARRDAHARMRQFIREIKQHTARELAQAEAALQTAKRRHQQRLDFALLESSRERLRAALLNRWHEHRGRAEWVDDLVRQALAVLPPAKWQITHPGYWPAAERKQLAERLAKRLGDEPEFLEAKDVTGGLRLCAQGACLDGTLEALLADRRAIEARLLAELQA